MQKEKHKPQAQGDPNAQAELEAQAKAQATAEVEVDKMHKPQEQAKSKATAKQKTKQYQTHTHKHPHTSTSRTIRKSIPTLTATPIEPYTYQRSTNPQTSSEVGTRLGFAYHTAKVGCFLLHHIPKLICPSPFERYRVRLSMKEGLASD